jgi:hypothetical protein
VATIRAQTIEARGLKLTATRNQLEIVTSTGKHMLLFNDAGDLLRIVSTALTLPVPSPMG